MNRIEIKALKWIAEATGYDPTKIIFSNNSSPDFTTPDGQGYEVKHYPPRAKSLIRTITFYPRQWLRLQNRIDCSVLVFGEGDKPDVIIPMTELPFGTYSWRNIHINCHETNPGSIPRELYLSKVKSQNKDKGADQTAPSPKEMRDHEVTGIPTV